MIKTIFTYRIQYNSKSTFIPRLQFNAIHVGIQYHLTCKLHVTWSLESGYAVLMHIKLWQVIQGRWYIVFQMVPTGICMSHM